MVTNLFKLSSLITVSSKQDGSYVKSKNSKLSYATMVFVRVLIAMVRPIDKFMKTRKLS